MKETVLAFQLREEDEGRVGRCRWWGGRREIGDRKGVIRKSWLKIVDGEEGGGEEERDRGRCVAYLRRFVEEFVEIACKQRNAARCSCSASAREFLSPAEAHQKQQQGVATNMTERTMERSLNPLGMLMLKTRSLTCCRDRKLEGPFCPSANGSSGEGVDNDTIRGSTIPGSETSVKVERYIRLGVVGDVERRIRRNVGAQRQRHIVYRLFTTTPECE